MKKVIALIEEKSKNLARNPFCRRLRDQNAHSISAQDALSFTPNMLFFVMGFQDILDQLEYAKPTDEIQKAINHHCEEDRNHWVWYLQDLKTLGFDHPTPGNGLSDLAKNLWHLNNRPTRELVYLCIHLIKKYDSPAVSMVIILCLEASFGVFISTLENFLANTPFYQKLFYFGQTHHDSELSHHLHSDKDQNYIQKISLEESEFLEMVFIVQKIFDQFELVFKAWLNDKDLLVSLPTKGERPLSLI
jgi:hypothetical protein